MMMRAFKETAKELLIIVGVSILVGFSVNAISPKGIAVFGKWDTSEGVVTAQPKSNGNYLFEEIEAVDVAKEIFDRGDSLFVDARHPDAYREGHIPGAISLPVGRFEEFRKDFMGRYPISTPIITYCSGRECDDSHTLARQLMMAGFTHIRIFIDGYPGWEAMGYPHE